MTKVKEANKAALAPAKEVKKIEVSKTVIAVSNTIAEKMPLTFKSLGSLSVTINEFLTVHEATEEEAVKGWKAILSYVKRVENVKGDVSASVKQSYESLIITSLNNTREVNEWKTKSAAKIAKFESEKKGYVIAYKANVNKSIGETVITVGNALPILPASDSEFLQKVILKHVVTESRRKREAYTPESVAIMAFAFDKKTGIYTRTVQFYDVQSTGVFTDNKAKYVNKLANVKRGIVAVNNTMKR